MKRFAFVVFLSLLIISSCTKPQETEDIGVKVEDVKPIQGGQLNLACVEPLDFNPVKITNGSYGEVSKLIFNGLFEQDKELKIIPVLAKGIDIDAEKGACIVELKNNIYWSDGNKLTSEDVKFTLDFIKKNSDSVYNDLSEIISYKVENEERIKINFRKPCINILQQLCIPIIPKHIYTSNEKAIPIGTGPYKVTEYKKLKYMCLEPNELHQNTKRPYIEKIRVNFVDDAYALEPFFQIGETDILHAASYDWEKYMEKKDIDTIKYISDSFEFILINHENQLLKDKLIRQAMMYAVDRKHISDKYLLGHTVLADTPIKPGTWLDDKKAIIYNYSRAEAQYILSNAGFSYNVHEKAFERDIEGEKQILRLSLITNIENEYRVKAAEDIKRYFEEAGFIIDLEILPFEEVEKLIEKGKYDLVLTGVNMMQDLISFLHSSRTIGGKNYGLYMNEEVDALMDAILSKQSDSRELMENYKKMQEILREDLPFLSLFYKEYALVTRNKVRGIIEPDSANLFRTIGDWYIIQDEDTSEAEE